MSGQRNGLDQAFRTRQGCEIIWSMTYSADKDGDHLSAEVAGCDAAHRARRIDNTPYARVNSGFLSLSERAIRTLFFIIAEDRRFFAIFLGCESHSLLVLASV